MMRFFSQKRRKDNFKSSSDRVCGPPSQSNDHDARPQSAPPQDCWFEAERPAKPARPQRGKSTMSFPPPPPLWDSPEDFDRFSRSNESVTRRSTQSFSQHSTPSEITIEGTTLQDVVGDKLSEIITMIDEDSYLGSHPELIISVPSPILSPHELTSTPSPVTADSEKTLVNFGGLQSRYQSKSAAQAQHLPNRPERTINFLTKVSYYANSRLPPSLPPLRVYLPTWPIFCLAAQYSRYAYSSPDASDWSDRASTYIPSNPAAGTKAMVIKSVPCDSKKTIVFAIRGTSVLSLRDWNTNLNTKPTSPAGFLDDPSNLCHAGFLRVAKAMILPIATRIRQLLQQNPSRSQFSLLITGHSAGGAVAALLYAHMLSQTVTSDLTILTSCFKRVHCVTFGTPPVSLMPLSKPPNSEERLRKCLFHTFINEGDPVVRAEKSYIKSLVDLVTTQPPSTRPESMRPGMMPVMAAGGYGQHKRHASQPVNNNKPVNYPITAQHLQSLGHLIPVPIPDEKEVVVSRGSSSGAGHSSNRPIWTLPPNTLANPGRLVVLRVAPQPYSPRQGSPEIRSPNLTASTIQQHEFETVHAETLADNQLRNVVFGDPLMHAMEVYHRRIEALATKAVTLRNMEP